MATSEIKYEPYLSGDRAGNVKYPELVTCCLCLGMLWLPKTCEKCDALYCSSCIKNWKLSKPEPTPCPNTDCSVYVERKCPGAVLHILNSLDITCRYKLYGCDRTLPYSSLETHEEACGYRQQTCSGCQQEIAKKDFREHESTCALVLLTCPECKTIYQRQHATQHTDTKCLREQLLTQKSKINKIEGLLKNLIDSLKQSGTNIRVDNVNEIFQQSGTDIQVNNVNESFQQSSSQNIYITEEND